MTEYAGIERQLTRTGIKFDASRAQMNALHDEMRGVAQDTAMPVQEVLALFDALAEAGNDLATSQALSKPVARAAQAMGGLGDDMAKTLDAAIRSFGIATSEAERFFDMVAYGGAAGKFEGSDLAQYLPKLAPIGRTIGMEGPR